MIKIRLFIYLFCLTYSSFLSSQILKEEDPQIIESIQEIEKQDSKILKIKVYYQYRQGDYIVFYDFKGDSLFLKYRIDQWDYSQDHLFRDMRQGLLYEVEFEFQEMVPALAEKDLSKQTTLFGSFLNRKPKQTSKLPIGRFIRLRIAYLDKLIY